jgi:GT2 family glycosyltransferase
MEDAVYPKITTIILNWNGKEDTLECIQSVCNSDYPNHELLLVDNGSEDDSVTSIRSQYPDITLIETGENLGFAEGNNVGIRHAIDSGTDYIFLLNNDTVLDPGAHLALVKATNDIDDKGILGAKTYYYDNPKMVWFDGGYWNKKTTEFFHDGYQIIEKYTSTALKECDYICGCALFIPVSIIQKIGLMDKDFFLTYEETDWCYRGKKQGFLSYVVPTAKVWHKVSVSFGGASSPLQEYFYTRNVLYWGERYLSPFQYLKLLRKCLSKTAGWQSSEKPSLTHFYWNLRRASETILRTGSPVSTARKTALWDYMCRKKGDCPQKIREL